MFLKRTCHKSRIIEPREVSLTPQLCIYQRSAKRIGEEIVDIIYDFSKREFDGIAKTFKALRPILICVKGRSSTYDVISSEEAGESSRHPYSFFMWIRLRLISQEHNIR